MKTPPAGEGEDIHGDGAARCLYRSMGSADILHPHDWQRSLALVLTSAIQRELARAMFVRSIVVSITFELPAKSI